MSENRSRGGIQMSHEADLSQDLIDLIHDAVLAFDAKGNIIFWNQSAEKTYGWTRDEMLGQPISQIQFEETPTDPASIELSCNAWEGELRHRHRNGSLLILQSRQIMRFNEEGQPDHVLSINRDITARRTLEMQLKAHTIELERSNAELESFARIASHDLREPLRMIGSYAKLLDRRYRDRLDEDGIEFLGYVVDGAERMSDMIKDLLAVARIGSEPINMQSVNLEDVLNTVLSDLNILVRENDTQIHVSNLPTISGDRSQLRRVFQNLIENAIKHHDSDQPRIEISAEKLLDIWRISVRDNGPGIEPEELNRIFIPYARGKNNRHAGGSGTGLAVARKIIQSHGGRIWVDSRPGSGATFYFTLPEQVKETS
jgi:PAS domain S-box-containing protein